MFKYQSIFYPELGVHVRFKLLDQQEITNFIAENEGVGHFEYAAHVLQECVFNLETDILMSMVLMAPEQANNSLNAVYNGCIMLNPALSGRSWINIAYSASPDMDTLVGDDYEPSLDDIKKFKDKIETSRKQTKARNRQFKISAVKFQNLERYLSERVIGQPEAVKSVVRALKLHHAGLQDKNRPIGVFLFAGPSGVGKTLLAQELHRYLFGTEYDLVRIDCGEFQHKHENQKLLGSPPGFVGHEDGGVLRKMEENPNTVVLLDEVEKAHPDVLNTFLRAFDEGLITDNKGQSVSFRNSIVIMTSNLGNSEVTEMIHGKGAGFNVAISSDFQSRRVPPRSAVERATREEMRKFFRPEFINRIDSTIVFNFLTEQDCQLIAELQLQDSEEKLSKLGFKLDWDQKVIDRMVELGYTSVSNARGMRSVRSKYIDELIADSILDSQLKKGTSLTISVKEDQFIINT